MANNDQRTTRKKLEERRLEVHPSLNQRIEVFSMSKALGIDTPGIGGRLLNVWGWATLCGRDGHVTARDCHTSKRYSHDESCDVGVACHTAIRAKIDEVAPFEGFADAMIGVGWLVVDDSGCYFPGWEEWNEHSRKWHKHQEGGARRMRESRAREKAARQARAAASQPSAALPEPLRHGDVTVASPVTTTEKQRKGDNPPPRSPPKSPPGQTGAPSGNKEAEPPPFVQPDDTLAGRRPVVQVCDEPEQHAPALAVCRHYVAAVGKPGLARGDALPKVMALLASGVTAEALNRASDAYAMVQRLTNSPPMGVAKFFTHDWAEYRDGSPKPRTAAKPPPERSRVLTPEE